MKRLRNLLVLLIPLSALAADPGAIQGIVAFRGETPPPAMWANRGDHECPHGIPQNHLQVRQENLGLANVLVILETEAERRVVDRQASLETKGCTLLPRVQWVPLGTSLKVTDPDGAAHGIRALLHDSSAWFLPLAAGQTIRRPMVQPGFYKINCDRHPWERAWIYVSEHPYVGLTNAEGRFEIKNVPPGKYRIRAWHEGWNETGKDPDGRPDYDPMEETRDVVVKAGAVAQVRFDNLQPSPH